MRIWLRRRANRAAFIAAGSCIGPVMNVNLVVVRNGTDAIALLCPGRLPQTANAGVGAFPGTQSLCGPGSGVDHDDDSWPEAGTCVSDPTSIADSLARVEAGGNGGWIALYAAHSGEPPEAGSCLLCASGDCLCRCGRDLGSVGAIGCWLS